MTRRLLRLLRFILITEDPLAYWGIVIFGWSVYGGYMIHQWNRPTTVAVTGVGLFGTMLLRLMLWAMPPHKTLWQIIRGG